MRIVIGLLIFSLVNLLDLSIFLNNFFKLILVWEIILVYFIKFGYGEF